MGMFEPSTNDSYYGLGLETVKIIREAVARSRGAVGDVPEGEDKGKDGSGMEGVHEEKR